MSGPGFGRDPFTFQLQGMPYLLHVGMLHLFFSIQLIPQCDYVVPVEIEWQWHNVYVIKRPGVDQFLKKMGELFEIVVFTASLSKVRHTIPLPIHAVVYTPLHSTQTQCWTSSMFTRWFPTGCSVRAATTIKATMSRLVHRRISDWTMG